MMKVVARIIDTVNPVPFLFSLEKGHIRAGKV